VANGSVEGKARPVVLVADDDQPTRELVALCLAQVGYDVVEAADAEQAERAMLEHGPALVVLDVTMPGRSGLDLLRTLDTRALGVILLSARSSEQDRILGLGLGADDYVCKPFSVGELVARVQAVLRRSRPSHGAARMDFGWLVIETDRREVYVNGSVVELTAKEFDLLAFLASSPGKVFSRRQLLQKVWSSAPEWQDAATVTEHMRRLRNKLEAPGLPNWLWTIRGAGYKFERRSSARLEAEAYAAQHGIPYEPGDAERVVAQHLTTVGAG
jgi:two-component system, OmpR family, phosphate regulon response regulator PhoB